MKEMIPTTKLVLPITKYTMELYEFLTTGETRKIQLLLANSGMSDSQNNPDQGKNVKTFYEMQDTAVPFLIKHIFKDQSDTPESIGDIFDFVGNLPNEDGNVLYTAITNIINASMLTDDSKKN